MIDQNIDLPFLIVTSDSQDLYERSGLVTVPYEFSATCCAKEEEEEEMDMVAST